MRRTRLAVEVVLLVLLLLGLSSAVAHASTPFDNGTFDTDLSSWNVGGSSPENCVWYADDGFPSSGSAFIGTEDSCYIGPAGETWLSTSYSVSVNLSFKNPYYAGMRITIFVGEGIVIDGLLPRCDDWCSGSTGWFNVPAGQTMHVYFQNDGTLSGLVDTVSYDLGDAGLSATATPRPAATPTGSPMSGGGAVALMTVSASTPGYDSGGTPSALFYSASPSASSDYTAGVRLVAENHVWGFCLPSQITRIFSDVPLCLELGTVTFPTWRLMGIDMVPYLSIIGSVIFIVFLIRQAQER